jgi:hypothetical protein
MIELTSAVHLPGNASRMGNQVLEERLRSG